jgi:transposase InsO family protein
VPYAIHTILTDNGIQFTNLARHKHAGIHIFYRVCAEHGIDHRLTKIKHPWTNGQVERMNRTIKAVPQNDTESPLAPHVYCVR